MKEALEKLDSMCLHDGVFQMVFSHWATRELVFQALDCCGVRLTAVDLGSSPPSTFGLSVLQRSSISCYWYHSTSCGRDTVCHRRKWAGQPVVVKR